MPYPPLSTVPFLEDYAPPSGSKLESIPRGPLAAANASVALPASGQGVGFAVMLQTGITYSSATFVSGGTAATLPTHQWVSLLDSTFHIITSSPDALTASWGSNASKTFTFTASYTPTAQTVAYVVLMVASTTMPTMLGSTGTVPSAINTGPIIVGTTITGQTGPSSNGTLLTLTGASRAFMYFYLS